MNTQEAAAYLDVSTVAIREAVRKMRLPVSVVTGRNGRKSYHFNREDLDNYRRRWFNREDGMLSVKGISSEYKVNQGRVRAALQRNKLTVVCNDGRIHLYRREDIQHLAQQERWI